MNTITWAETFLISIQNVWVKIISFFPQVLGALIALIFGLLLASALGRFAKKLFGYTKLDKLSEKMGLKKDLEGLGLHFTFADLIGWVVKWFFIIVTLITVVDILHISQITQFLGDVALYIPNVIVAIMILAIGLVAGKFISNLSRKAIMATHIASSSAGILAALAKWSIFIFALMAALVQLGIAGNLIQILFTGIVIMISLAGGLAFGLGGRDKAAKILEKIEQEISNRNR